MSLLLACSNRPRGKDLERDAIKTLKITSPTAVCNAERGCPIEASSAVAVVPILAPNTSAMPASSGIRPCEASAMTTPSVAVDELTTAVNTAPIRMPGSGLVIDAISSRNGWCVRSGCMKLDIRPSPMKRMPRPIITVPARLAMRLAFHSDSPKPAAVRM